MAPKMPYTSLRYAAGMMSVSMGSLLLQWDDRRRWDAQRRLRFRRDGGNHHRGVVARTRQAAEKVAGSVDGQPDVVRARHDDEIAQSVAGVVACRFLNEATVVGWINIEVRRHGASPIGGSSGTV